MCWFHSTVTRSVSSWLMTAWLHVARQPWTNAETRHVNFTASLMGCHMMWISHFLIGCQVMWVLHFRDGMSRNVDFTSPWWFFTECVVARQPWINATSLHADDWTEAVSIYGLSRLKFNSGHQAMTAHCPPPTDVRDTWWMMTAINLFHAGTDSYCLRVLFCTVYMVG